MTTSLMMMLGCLLLTSHTMAAISLPWGIYVRDADGGGADVAEVKKVLNDAKVKVDTEVPFELKEPLNDLLTLAGEKLDKAQDAKAVRANKYNGDRRRFNPNFDLGGGWSVGLGGVQWQSQNGGTTFTVKPTFDGLTPSGVHAGLVFHF